MEKRSARQHGDWTKFRLNLKLAGWWPAVLSFGLLGAYLLARIILFPADSLPERANSAHVLEVIIPIVFAVQAANLLAPENEASLELLMAGPQPMPKLFLERLGLMGSIHLSVAVLFTVIFALIWHEENPAITILRWLVDAVALGGVAAFTTQLTRQSIFGTLLATLLGAASLSGGDSLLRAWKWFWPFHLYLQPETAGMSTFFFNRLILGGLGLGLFWIALRFLNDGDRLLGTR